jgi:hypothetical protein
LQYWEKRCRRSRYIGNPLSAIRAGGNTGLQVPVGIVLDSDLKPPCRLPETMRGSIASLIQTYLLVVRFLHRPFPRGCRGTERKRVQREVDKSAEIFSRFNWTPYILKNPELRLLDIRVQRSAQG